MAANRSRRGSDSNVKHYLRRNEARACSVTDRRISNQSHDSETESHIISLRQTPRRNHEYESCPTGTKTSSVETKPLPSASSKNSKSRKSKQDVGAAPAQAPLEQVAQLVLPPPAALSDHPEWLTPFEKGWKREIVSRNTIIENSTRRPCDVYYFTPEGKKCRSIPQISDYLKETKSDLTLDCFTFTKDTIYIEPFESYRRAGAAGQPKSNQGRQSSSSSQHTQSPGSPSKSDISTRTENLESSSANGAETNKSGKGKRKSISTKNALQNLIIEPPCKTPKLSCKRAIKFTLLEAPPTLEAPSTLEAPPTLEVPPTLEAPPTLEDPPTLEASPTLEDPPSKSNSRKNLKRKSRSNSRDKKSSSRNRQEEGPTDEPDVTSDDRDHSSVLPASIPDTPSVQEESSKEKRSRGRPSKKSKRDSSSSTVQTPLPSPGEKDIQGSEPGPESGETIPVPQKKALKQSNDKKSKHRQTIALPVEAMPTEKPANLKKNKGRHSITLPVETVPEAGKQFDLRNSKSGQLITPPADVSADTSADQVEKQVNCRNQTGTQSTASAAEALPGEAVPAEAMTAEAVPGKAVISEAVKDIDLKKDGQSITLPSKTAEKIDPQKPFVLNINNNKFMINPDSLTQVADGLRLTLPTGAQLDNVHAKDNENELEIKNENKTDAKTRLKERQEQLLFNFDKKLAGYESILKVFQYLSICDLLRAGSVCKTWRNVSLQPILWRSVSLNKCHVSDWDTAVAFLAQHEIVRLDLKEIHIDKEKKADFWRILLKSLQSLDSLRFLELGICPVSVMRDVAELKQLKGVKIEFISKSPAEIPLSKAAFDNSGKAVKTELDLSKFSQMNGLEVLRISSLCGLTLKNQKCLNNLSQLKSLKALSLTSLRGVPEKSLAFIKHLESLQVLEIGECHLWKNEIYNHLGRLVNLKALKLECGGDWHGGKLVTALSKMPKLCRLELIKYRISDDLLSYLPSMSQLRGLIIYPELADDQQKQAVFNLNVMTAVGQMEFLHQLDWGFFTYIGNWANLTAGIRTKDFIPLAASTSEEDKDPDLISNVELLKRLVVRIPDTEIRLRVVPIMTV